MNQNNPILGWRSDNCQKALNPRGWTVVFAKDGQNTMPTLDYAEGKDIQSDEKHPFTPKQIQTLAGYVKLIQGEGPRALKHGTQFRAFQHPDNVDGMAELRFKSTEGHRLLCFQRPGQRFVIACGFVKPRQPETPPDQKARARAILAEHEKREAEERKAAERAQGWNSRPRK